MYYRIHVNIIACSIIVHVNSFAGHSEASRSRIDSVEIDHREFEDEGKFV